MRIVLMLIGFLVAAQASASGRYLTWVDDQGRVHNSFVDNRYTAHQRAAAGNIQRSDQARLNEGEVAVWPGSKSSGESKRRYFTWVDASGNLQNSFYAGQQVQAGGNEVLLGTGERSSAYISSDVLEGRDFARDEQDGRYFTWVDEQGRMRNSRCRQKVRRRQPQPCTMCRLPKVAKLPLTPNRKPCRGWMGNPLLRCRPCWPEPRQKAEGAIRNWSSGVVGNWPRVISPPQRR